MPWNGLVLLAGQLVLLGAHGCGGDRELVALCVQRLSGHRSIVRVEWNGLVLLARHLVLLRAQRGSGNGPDLLADRGHLDGRGGRLRGGLKSGDHACADDRGGNGAHCQRSPQGGRVCRARESERHRVALDVRDHLARDRMTFEVVVVRGQLNGCSIAEQLRQATLIFGSQLGTERLSIGEGYCQLKLFHCSSPANCLRGNSAARVWLQTSRGPTVIESPRRHDGGCLLAQELEDARVDPAGGGGAFLEVLDRHPLQERVRPRRVPVRRQLARLACPDQTERLHHLRQPPAAGRLWRVAGPLESVLDLRRQRLVDWKQVRDGGSVEVEMVELQQPFELVNRCGMVVDTQVDPTVVVAAVAAVLAYDEERRRLAPALVTAALVGGPERTQQQLRERCTSGDERVHECIDDVATGQDVALRGDVVGGPSAGPVDAPGTRVSRGAAARVDDAQLAVLAALVRVGETANCLVRGSA